MLLVSIDNKLFHDQWFALCNNISVLQLSCYKLRFMNVQLTAIQWLYYFCYVHMYTCMYVHIIMLTYVACVCPCMHACIHVCICMHIACIYLHVCMCMHADLYCLTDFIINKCLGGKEALSITFLWPFRKNLWKPLKASLFLHSRFAVMSLIQYLTVICIQLMLHIERIQFVGLSPAVVPTKPHHTQPGARLMVSSASISGMYQDLGKCYVIW